MIVCSALREPSPRSPRSTSASNVYDPRRVNGYRLDRAAIARLRTRLGALTVAERAELPCLERRRADLIVPGLAIVIATIDRIGVGELLVSDAGLREGMMADTIARLANR